MFLILRRCPTDWSSKLLRSSLSLGASVGPLICGNSHLGDPSCGGLLSVGPPNLGTLICGILHLGTRSSVGALHLGDSSSVGTLHLGDPSSGGALHLGDACLLLPAPCLPAPPALGSWVCSLVACLCFCLSPFPCPSPSLSYHSFMQV